MIPAALVILMGFGVLHQYFAVILNVSSSATDAIELDAVTPPSAHRPDCGAGASAGPRRIGWVVAGA